MDKNNLKSFMGKMNDFREIIEVNQGTLMNMAEQIREGKFPVETSPFKKPANKKVTKGQRTTPKRTKDTNHTPVKENRQQIMEQHERKRQEAVYQEDERLQNREATRVYWQEAMMLAEIVGPPACKRRSRRRPGGL